MHSGTIVTRSEIEQTLAEAGYKNGSPEWFAALKRNWIPLDNGVDQYAEADDFDLEADRSPST